MATKFYIDQQGNYLGGFDGSTPDVPSLEVATPPEDARMMWDGNQWIIPDELKPKITQEKYERVIYSKIKEHGITDETILKALYEKVANNDSADLDAIKVIVDQAVLDNPFPTP